MAGMIFFTDNYQDRSSDDGYQFEFFCRRCGNGYSSSFQHSVTGFGGRLLRLGGDVVGGAIGERAAQVGWDAEFMRDTVRGSTRDKALAKAVEEMKPHFHQCNRCGQWVCGQVCWNTRARALRDLRTQARPGNRRYAGGGAGQSAESEDPGSGLDQGHQLPRPRDRRLPVLRADSGGGKFCKNCGHGLAAAPSAAKFCPNCGTALNGAKFCGECGTAAR